MISKTNGLVAAPFSPLTGSGEIEPAKIKGYADGLIRNGVKGVFVNGTTCEGLSLTKKERKILVEAWLKQ